MIFYPGKVPASIFLMGPNPLYRVPLRINIASSNEGVVWRWCGVAGSGFMSKQAHIISTNGFTASNKAITHPHLNETYMLRLPVYKAAACCHSASAFPPLLNRRVIQMKISFMIFLTVNLSLIGLCMKILSRKKNKINKKRQLHFITI